MFIQLHTLTSYPSALLNRDDIGFAKTLPFGGTIRTRVSSQCLKYHWRKHDGKMTLKDTEIPLAVRSREIFRDLIAEKLDAPPAHAAAAAFTMQKHVVGAKSPTKKEIANILDSEDPMSETSTDQPLVLGPAEIDHLRGIAQDLCNQAAEANDGDVAGVFTGAPVNKDQMKNLSSGLDAALFGRMATSEVLSQTNAALHVAHAFTVHAQEQETDYFAVVDDLTSAEGEKGSSHLNSKELTSGLYYSYVAVDVPLLISNLNEDPQIAAEVMRRFVHILTTVSPGAKLSSTAPHSRARCIIAETGDGQPRTLANAFRDAVPQTGAVQKSYEAIDHYVREMDGMYGTKQERRAAGMDLPDGFVSAKQTTVPNIAEWTAEQITSAQ